MTVTFLLTLTYVWLLEKLKIQMLDLRGGRRRFIEECIKPDFVYELLDPGLEIFIKKMFYLPMTFNSVVIVVPVLILSCFIYRQPIRQMTILGVSVFVDQVKSLPIKIAIGVVSKSVFFILPVGVVSLTGALLAGAIVFNVVQDFIKIECNNLVSKVPMERPFKKKIVGFLDKPR